MRTLEAHGRKQSAIRRARELQREAGKGVLVCVERDLWKEPWSYRIVSFDLHNERDRSYIKPIGVERVDGVYPIMFMRRIALVLPPRKVEPVSGLIAEYKAKRRQRSRRSKVAA